MPNQVIITAAIPDVLKGDRLPDQAPVRLSLCGHLCGVARRQGSYWPSPQADGSVRWAQTR